MWPASAGLFLGFEGAAAGQTGQIPLGGASEAGARAPVRLGVRASAAQPSHRLLTRAARAAYGREVGEREKNSTQPCRRGPRCDTAWKRDACPLLRSTRRVPGSRRRCVRSNRRQRARSSHHVKSFSGGVRAGVCREPYCAQDRLKTPPSKTDHAAKLLVGALDFCFIQKSIMEDSVVGGSDIAAPCSSPRRSSGPTIESATSVFAVPTVMPEVEAPDDQVSQNQQNTL
jgi:hypothetical protein